MLCSRLGDIAFSYSLLFSKDVLEIFIVSFKKMQIKVLTLCVKVI